MGKCYLAGAAALALLVAGVSAQAAGRGAGNPPPGFSSPGAHSGFETFTNTTTTTGPNPTTTTTTTNLPGGWDEGNASWKSNLQNSNPTLNTLPPGLGK